MTTNMPAVSTLLLNLSEYLPEAGSAHDHLPHDRTRDRQREAVAQATQNGWRGEG